jgi:hypothetical protein
MNSRICRIIAVGFMLLPAVTVAQDTIRKPVFLPDSAGRNALARDAADEGRDRTRRCSPSTCSGLSSSCSITPELTEAQRNVIVQEISRLQATAVQVQWRVADESEKLAGLLERDSVAEAEVLSQAERMMGFETAVKRAQLSMLIRIRNVLSAEQRAMLRDLRKRE